jgi:hypothetical protein
MKYFFDNITKYDTIWYGFIAFEKNIEDCINNNLKNNQLYEDELNNEFYQDDLNNENIEKININKYKNIINNIINNIIIEISNINYCINYDNNIIYLSIENDGNYYDYIKFEKDIRPIIIKISELFNNKFINGEFTGVEYKPDGFQYKYRIFNDEKNNKITMKKRILNW